MHDTRESNRGFPGCLKVSDKCPSLSARRRENLRQVIFNRPILEALSNERGPLDRATEKS